MASKYVIGIDLGTTNSVVAYATLENAQSPEIRTLPIPQLVAAGTVETQPSLPSFLYLPPAHEQQGTSFDLPWGSQADYVVGQWARQQSASAPERTVGGAKSWLAHTAVDRHAAILPWDAPDEVAKISPVTATRRYLEHLIAAWNETHPETPLVDQQVVLTVPACIRLGCSISSGIQVIS